MSTPKTWLRDLRITKVDLVDDGDNPLARVALFKARAFVVGDGVKIKRGKEHDEAHAGVAMTVSAIKDGAYELKMPDGTKHRWYVAAELIPAKKSNPVRKEAGDPPTVGELLEQREAADSLQKLHWAFQDSMSSILWSGSANKVELLGRSVAEFGERLSEIVEPVTVALKAAPGESAEDFAERAQATVAELVTKARETMSKSADLDLKTIPEAQRPAVEALQKRATEADQSLAAVTKERDDQKARADKAEAEVAKLRPADPYPGMTEAAREEMKKRDERIAKLEGEGEEREAVTKARALGTVPGIAAEKLGPIMLRVAKGKATAEDVTELERVLKGAAEIAKDSALFRKQGSAGTGAAGGDAQAKIEALVGEAVAKGAKSRTEARKRVLSENPDLARQYEAEQSAA